LEKLKYCTAISIIKEIPTDGHSPLLIISDDYEKYYVKSARGEKPAISLINEILCHYFLKKWRIPTPDIAIIKLNPELIVAGEYSTFHKKHYYLNYTFGSKALESVKEMDKFTEIRNKNDYKKFVNPEVLIKIGLFDIWIENTDRKPSNNNILFQFTNNLISIYAIDNAYTLNHMSYSDLRPEYNVTNTYNDNILETNIAKAIINQYGEKNWLKKLKYYFNDSIRKCEISFDEIIQLIPKEFGLTAEIKKYIFLFLFDKNRNKEVFNEFLTRI
jgi:HipA-like kinase